MIEDSAAADIFDRYVLIGVAHAHMSSLGLFSFDKIDFLMVKDSEAKPLQLLTGDEIPPTIVGALSLMEASLSRSLGQFGKGIHWFVFTGGSTHACGSSGISIPFAGETYTYDTPMPGCPKA